MRYLSVNRSGTNGENPDKSRIFHLPGTNWLKPGQNPDISEKPPGQRPKKRTCPGKPGRMVSLVFSAANIHENWQKLQKNMAWVGHALRMTGPCIFET